MEHLIVKILLLLPGLGKTWVARKFPNRFVDTDEVYETTFPGWSGKFHMIPKLSKLAALRAAAGNRIVLTNDHSLPHTPVIPESIEQYIALTRRRSDLRAVERSLIRWYVNLDVESGDGAIRVSDPALWLERHSNDFIIERCRSL
jgi:hypothetical protein